MENQYHHYIPQFILRNFNIKDTKDKKYIKIKYYDIKSKKMEECKTNKKYGDKNLYKDSILKDVMEIEKGLSKLENKCSILIDNINRSNNYTEIIRKDLYELRKFLYIMLYRTKSRKKQYIDGIFDEDTKELLNLFMKKNNFNKYDEVWLNNIKELLKSNYNEIQYNNNIFSYIRWEFTNNVEFNSINIWEAKGDSEFIITTKCFGIYEGTIGNIYHYFYIISPKRIVVLTNNIEKTIMGDYIGMFPKYIHKNHIILYKNHKIINKIKSFPNPLTEKYIKPYFEDDDVFKIQINIVDENIVYLINSIFLEEENEGITFKSSNNLYNSIWKYENNSIFKLKRNYKQLKSILKMDNIIDINNINYIDFPYDKYINKEDLIRLFKYNNSYFLEMLVKQTNILNNIEKQYIMENGYPIDTLPDQLQLKDGIVLKCKEMIEIYLSQMSQIRYVYTNYEIKLINKELLNIPLVNIVVKHNIDNNNKTIFDLNKIFKIQIF